MTSSIFGPLDSCSAFEFENHMQQLKKHLRKHHQPLAQISKRLFEEMAVKSSFKDSTKSREFKNKQLDGPLGDNCIDPQFKCLNLNGVSLKCNSKDCYCLIVDGTVVKIKNFAYSKHLGEMVMVGKSFCNKTNLFKKPCKSSKLNIFKISQINTSLDVWRIDSISTKLFVVPFKSEFVALPLLHLNI